MLTRRGPGRLLLLALLVCVAAWGSSASAATLIVDTTADELTVNGHCSLREAIRAANLDLPQDSCPAGSALVRDFIDVPRGTYLLGLGPAGDDVGSRGDLDIFGSVAIVGAGPRTIIDGAGMDRLFDIHGGATVGFAGITIRKGLASSGGGIQVGGSADLVLLRATIRSNTADEGGGIAVLSSGEVLISESVIRHNTAPGSAGQGGGMLLSSGADVELVHSTVRGNTAVGNSAFAGGGISNFGTLDVLGTTIAGNTATNGGGGGIFSGGTATLQQSTVSGNSAALDGGGLSSVSPLTVRDSTISGNMTESSGGGLFNNGGTLTVQNATIAENTAIAGQGGGLANWNFAANATVKNSILGGNTANAGAPDCYGPITSQSRNLIQNTTGCTGTSPVDIVGRNPRLGRLLFNGGHTRTHRILFRSRARNAGSGCRRRDQRGVPRPQGSRCDLGSYELAFCGRRVVNVVGSSGNDRLVGTGKNDAILGLGGRDRLVGRGGNDSLCGGAGNDVLLGGAGRDRLVGGAGRDRCSGGPRADDAAGCERTSSLRFG